MTIKHLHFGPLRNIVIISLMAIVAGQGSCSKGNQNNDVAARNDGPTHDAAAGAEAAGTDDAAFAAAAGDTGDGAGAVVVDGRDRAEVGDLRAALDADGTPKLDAGSTVDVVANVPVDVDAHEQDTAVDVARTPYRIDATGIDAIGGRYIRVSPIPGQPVVLDTKTQLVWQGCPAGVSGDGCTTGLATSPTWHSAVDFCRDLDWAGYDDWYLPEQDQLRMLTSTDRRSGIDTDAFPGTPQSSCAWSSTVPPELWDSYAVCVYNNGNPSSVGKTWNASDYVRCVRSGP
jgi:hypothetical protein